MVRRLLCLLILLVVTVVCRASDQSAPPKNVDTAAVKASVNTSVQAAVGVASSNNILILNSYHRGFDWTDRQVSGICDYFVENMPTADVFVEYLDTKRFSNTEVWRKMLEIALSKYPPGFLDIVIVTDDNAYDVLRANHDQLNGLPTVFCGINNYDSVVKSRYPDMTGITEKLDFEGTWQLGCQLMNRAFTRVAVIVDNTTTGVAFRADAQKWFDSRPDLQPLWLDGHELSHDELIRKLKSSNAETLYIMGVWKRDKNDMYMRTHEYYPQIAAAANGPVFSLVEIGLDDGLIGGCILDGYRHGRYAASVAAEIITGTPADQIPVTAPATSKIELYYPVMQKWKLSVPSGVNWTVIGRPNSFYAQHKKAIWSAIAVFSFETALVCLLIFNFVHRRRVTRALVAANAALSDREENLRITLKSIGDAVIATDCDGHVVQMNHVAEMLTGYNAEQARGKVLEDVFKIINADTRQPVENPVEAVMRTGKTQGLANHTVLVDRHGYEHQIADSAAPIISAENALKGVVLTFRDVTADYEKDQMLTQARQQIDLVLANTGEQITYMDCDLNVQWTNFVDADGGSIELQNPDGSIKKCYQLRYDRDSVCDGCCIEQAINSDSQCVHELKFPDGSVSLVHSTPVHDDDGNIIGAVEAIRDITDRHNLTQQLIHSDRMNAVGRLAGGIAHDFNNLLQVILGYGELLKSQLAGSSVDSLDHVMDAAQKARSLVRQLLLFSRKREVEARAVRPDKLLEDTASLLRPLLGESITLELRGEKTLKPILVDPEQIQQVLVNICINARDAMSGRGKIRIAMAARQIDSDEIKAWGLDRSGEYVSFSIADTGPGISHENLDHIFEPFFTTKNIDKGSGLGLSTAYAIIKRHGGTIIARNIPSTGAEFQFLLPVTQAEDDQDEESKTQPKPIEHKDGDVRGLVLLGEDEEMVRKLSSRLLKELGFNVIAAVNGQEAVDIFSQRRDEISLVILDAMMPILDGPQACKQIKQIRPDVPVLFATGYSRELLEGDFLLKTPGKLIQKPFTMATLRQAVDELLG